ncbi:PREDICTED: ubiquitin carboxyl-terminal hydrolase 6-like [Galeopterus variegatus]|uniref:Ubiquitin carboxyl-terminal hydrolase 6-like n=1 Tax=Galeopterus variegatus TaxID=482537 RepID=A0ABM0SF78_GALVR|nr:PREDICTED: ubiquitin carboxyl-terminal hydrolase 6-like [Galeopterus variegatus]
MFSQEIQRIDLEASRTFTNHIMFRERHGIEQQALLHLPVACLCMTQNDHRSGNKLAVQCFKETPFGLTLRLWDVCLLEGEHLLAAVACATLEVHRKHLQKLPLEDTHGFLHDQLSVDWVLDDDNEVLRHLQAPMAELHRVKCDLPPPPDCRNVLSVRPGRPRSNQEHSRDPGPWGLSQKDQIGSVWKLTTSAFLSAAPEEFPRKALSLELVSPAPSPRLAFLSVETLPKNKVLALSGPPAQGQQLREAEAQWQEGTSAEPRAVTLSLGP